MNDPNGPIEIDGTTHLYFQYRSTLDLGESVQWGHASSTDLLRWDYHRPAISPAPQGPDRDGCYSGNTVLDASGSIRAFYSGNIRDEALQRTLAAVSEDGGRSFGPPREVVGPPAADEGIVVLRDPFVWRANDGWRMIVGAGTSDHRAVLLHYTSVDLDRWTYQGHLAELGRSHGTSGDTGEMWECPQTFPAGGADVAVVGAWTATDGILKVLSMVVPGAGDASAPALELVDEGPNFYAASVMRDTPLGPVMWAWATEGRSPEACQADGWSGVLTLPRVVGLSPTGRVTSRPVPQMTSLRDGPGRDLGQGSLGGLPAQLELAIDSGASSTQPVDLRLAFGASEYLQILVDPVRGRVVIDRSHVNPDARPGAAPDIDQVLIEGLDDLRTSEEPVRAFVDGSILELFLPGGRVATTRFYPAVPPPWRIELQDAHEGDRVQVWSLAT